VTWLSTLGLTIILPRYLGDVSLGRMNFAFAFADWFGLLASFGITTYVTKEVARRPAEAGSVVMNALVLRIAMTAFLAVAVVVLAAMLPLADVTRTLVQLLTVHMLLIVLSGVLIGGLQGTQDIRSVAWIDAVSKTVQLGLIAVVLLEGYGAVGVAVAYIASDLSFLALLLNAVRSRIGLRARIEPSSWPRMIRGGVPFMVWETALLTYARVDVLILAIFAHAAVLGWYAAAYRIISLPLFLPAIVMTVVLPALAANTSDASTFNSIARRAIQAVALTTVPMSIGLMLVAPAVIRLFCYPAEFDRSIAPLIVLASTLPLVGFNMIVGSVLTARDRQRQWAIAGVVAAVLNLSLNFVAIPYTQETFGNGAIGAAAVTSATEVVLVVAGLLLCPRGVFDGHTFSVLGRCFVASLVMGVVLWPVRDTSVLVSIPLGVAAFATSALVLRVVSPGDIRALRGLIRRGGAAPSAVQVGEPT
jgi:O-antigen/teichoic acid export membrane protein